MCGIAGIVDLAGQGRVQLSRLARMATAIRHRGPDDESFHVSPDGNLGLAFRRLSIIDLAGGRQPMANEDGAVHLVFNGEIYNYLELRRELVAAGHRFATASDSEVIVHGYEQWGTGVFARLAGMFAIAIWDSPRRELILARDRLGKKPLHFAAIDGQCYFGSEIKSILAALPETPVVDPGALHFFFMFQYVPAPLGVFVGFRKLLPGTFIRVRPGHSPALGQSEQFWRLPDPGQDAALDERDITAELGRRVTAAVERRLIADVPLGAFLSGGVDSSIVVGVMRRLGVSPLRTFSIGFDDPRYDESAAAAEVARHFQTEHHAQRVTPRAREALDALAFHFDEPFADSSALPTYYVSKYARESVTVALTGDGGDECFGGYDRYVAMHVAGRLDWLPRPLRSGIARLSEWLPHGRAKSLSNRAYRFLSALGRSEVDRYLEWISVFPAASLATGYRREFRERLRIGEPIEWFSHLMNATAGSLSVRANRADVLSYLPYDLLTKVDTASMACSLECRCPLLDHEVVEFAMSTRATMWRAGPERKRLVKRWASEFLPPAVFERPKMGFGVPIGEWLRQDLRDLLDRLLDRGSFVAAIFEREYLGRLVHEHLSVRANREHRLWALLMLELWAERWAVARPA
ncbi:MAG: asparagine synthase (glutamine-hydrolyzing) [Phycisphaerales bacterium]|nr:asparagine synthase (glutamine-hydrolyzing) [Phycisphaerales bacterium]